MCFTVVSVVAGGYQNSLFITDDHHFDQNVLFYLENFDVVTVIIKYACSGAS